MLLAVVGPTATGKSDLALELGDALGGPENVEVIGADAMQFYRGMDIGTAKLPLDRREGYLHHQIDVLDIDEEASVAKYQADARLDIADVEARGKTAILVGGSGLYVRAVLDPISFPGTDPEVRARLEAEAAALGSDALHQRLALLDPVSAGRIDPRNTRRVIRALEVIELTGQPFSASLPEYRYVRETVQVGLNLPTEVLDQRIAERTEAMFAEGLVEEVANLQKQGLAETKTASRATGYREVLDMLNGRIDQQEAKDAISLATRQLARRQIKWFRRDPRIRWFDPREPSVTDQVMALLGDLQDPVALA